MSDQHRRRRHNPDGSLIPHGTRYSLGAAPRQPSARRVDSSQEDTGWTRYTDPNTGYDYLYNATTGESRWVEEHRKDHAARRIQRSLSRRATPMATSAATAKDHAARRIQRSLSRRAAPMATSAATAKPKPLSSATPLPAAGRQAGDRRSKYVVSEPRQQNARVAPVYVGQPEDDAVQEPEQAWARDPLFAFLLVGNLCALASWVPSGRHAFRDSDFSFATTAFFNAALALTALGIVLSAKYVALLLHAAGEMIVRSVYGTLVLLGILTIVFLVTDPLEALITALLFALTLCWWRLVRDRVPFAAAVLTTACTALTDYWEIFVVAFAALAVSLAFVVFWIYAAVGAISATMVGDCDADDEEEGRRLEEATDDDGDECYIPSHMSVWLIISLVWGFKTISYVMHLTAAGTVAAWWFGDGHRERHQTRPVSGALGRACTTSLGSASCAALIMAILHVIKLMARQATKGKGCLMQCIARCILQCIEEILRYFNKWALAYCGIYGQSFGSAGASVLALFGRVGWDAIINDDLVETCLIFACLVVACATACAGGLVGYAVHGVSAGERARLLAVIGFFCGYECCNIVMSVILSGVCTIFICFAEDASALQRTRPQTYNTLVHGWHEFSPYPIEPILAGRPCGPVRAHYARIGTYRLCYRACVHAACTACVRATAEDRVGTIVESIEDGQ